MHGVLIESFKSEKIPTDRVACLDRKQLEEKTHLEAYKLVKVDRSQLREINNDSLLKRWSSLIELKPAERHPNTIRPQRKSQYPNIDRVLLARSKRLEGCKQPSDTHEAEKSAIVVSIEMNQEQECRDSQQDGATQCSAARQDCAAVTASLQSGQAKPDENQSVPGKQMACGQTLIDEQAIAENSVSEGEIADGGNDEAISAEAACSILIASIQKCKAEEVIKSDSGEKRRADRVNAVASQDE
eukprot:763450-Hanusia_phi.AAC.4